ncbi:MAG: hypothetical protein EBR62_07170, partial [Verrucomicrobia bacterium]|nr:hypothetical protein [Verrucomicrobiota bacterium]
MASVCRASWRRSWRTTCSPTAPCASLRPCAAGTVRKPCRSKVALGWQGGVLGYLPAVAPTLPSLSALRASVAAWPRLAVGRLDPVEPLGVAVSGGADSIYLLLALWADAALRPWLRVWHFNHRVRGADAAADARFVQDLCTLLAVPCVVGVRAAEGLASEAELRAARLAFFAEQRVA